MVFVSITLGLTQIICIYQMVSKNWWCIHRDCKHYREHVKHCGKSITHEGCRHPAIMDELDFINPNLGLSIEHLRMCPVLVSDASICFEEGYFDKSL